MEDEIVKCPFCKRDIGSLNSYFIGTDSIVIECICGKLINIKKDKITYERTDYENRTS